MKNFETDLNQIHAVMEFSVLTSGTCISELKFQYSLNLFNVNFGIVSALTCHDDRHD